MHRERGFTLLELLMAMTITVIALGVALTAVQDVTTMSETAALMSDANQSLRTSMNMVTRDVLTAGRLVPIGGIPIPTGGGAVPIVRPSPVGTNVTFPVGDLTIPAVSPGDALGPAVNGTNTDLVTVLIVDNAPMCGTPLALSDLPLTAVAADGSAMTVDPAIPINCALDAIAVGDLIMVTNAFGNAMQMVTSVLGQVISFAATDPMNLNQRAAPQGTIMQLQSAPGVYPTTTASRVQMISYYIDTAQPNRPRLMRRLNLNADRALGIGIENFQLTYDLVDGALNPVNQPTIVPPNTPHQIRKANLFMAGRSFRAATRSRQFLRNSLSTQISLRSLSFIDRYR